MRSPLCGWRCRIGASSGRTSIVLDDGVEAQTACIKTHVVAAMSALPVGGHACQCNLWRAIITSGDRVTCWANFICGGDVDVSGFPEAPRLVLVDVKGLAGFSLCFVVWSDS